MLLEFLCSHVLQKRLQRRMFATKFSQYYLIPPATAPMHLANSRKLLVTPMANFPEGSDNPLANQLKTMWYSQRNARENLGILLQGCKQVFCHWPENLQYLQYRYIMKQIIWNIAKPRKRLQYGCQSTRRGATFCCFFKNTFNLRIQDAIVNVKTIKGFCV